MKDVQRRLVPASLGIGVLAAALSLPLVLACDRAGMGEVTAEEGELVAQLAEPAAGELLRTLVGRLTAALEEGGPAHAVEFCSTEALPMTHMLEARLEGVGAMKRTSFRYRNPANAPDDAEEQALRFFEDALLAEGSAPPRYVQRASEAEYRFYMPLFLGEMCLQCHGDREVMDPGVRAALEERYPTDLATGYSAGDFRGLVRVSVPAEAVSAALESEGE
jgi:hypothetical protein